MGLLHQSGFALVSAFAGMTIIKSSSINEVEYNEATWLYPQRAKLQEQAAA